MTQTSLPLTEQQNPRTHHLDRQSVAELVALMHGEDQAAFQAVGQAQAAITATIEQVVAALRQGGRLFYTGAGTSGRLGVLDASECPPTFRSPPEMVQGLIAGGTPALTHAVEGAEDDPEAGVADLRARGLGPLDTVVGIAASGSTPYVRAGLRYAKSLGCSTALLACNPLDQDDPAIDVYLILPVGPELVTGSTRLKAGTATKLALNMISTISMIQLGKVYDNLMVDLQISNQKLQKRARRMLGQLTGVDEAVADQLLQAAQGEVKTALMMHATGVDYAQAHQLLDASEGHLHRALTGYQAAAEAAQ